MSRQGLLVIGVLVLAAAVWLRKPADSSSDSSSGPVPAPSAVAAAPAAASGALPSAATPVSSPVHVNRPATPQAASQAAYFKGRILAGVNAAKYREHMALRLDSAFSLSQLEAAKAKAIREHKPLGFVMVWGKFFGGKALDSRGSSSAEGMVHFYRAFKDTLVLVYVLHESELGLVPDAVKKGFNGPDEGGLAPNMAVVDASASEFIVEIPFGGSDSTGEIRDGIFTAGAQKIETWLSTHPNALTQDPGKQ